MGKNRNVRRNQGRSSRPTGLASANTRPARSSVGYLIHSNAPFTGTGYGVQTAHLAQSIKRDNRTVTLSCNYGLQGTISAWEGIELLPTGFHPYSADILAAHTKYAEETTGKQTALITLFDCWVYKNSNVDSIPVIASWVPIDHMPAPSDVIEWCTKPNVLPIAMAQFGSQMLDRAGIEHMYVPHGVDTRVFHPDAKTDGLSGRELLNVPADAFLVGIVAANKGVAPLRKAWGENLLALGQFMNEHDDVYVYVHTEKKGAQGGIDLVALAAACGLPEDRLVWTDQWAYYAGLSPDVLATLMAGCDVNLACSRGEGFGVPVIEMASCGVPSIVSNFTAQPELVDGFGYLASVQPYWDAAQRTWFATPLVHSIVEQLEDAYGSARDSARREVARETMVEKYDHRVVFDQYWRPVLDAIDARFER